MVKVGKPRCAWVNLASLLPDEENWQVPWALQLHETSLTNIWGQREILPWGPSPHSAVWAFLSAEWCWQFPRIMDRARGEACCL